MDVHCTSLDEVRQGIDEIDRNLVSLLAKRGRLVTQAAAFKKTTDDARAPARVEQVIRKVREMADETGASAEVVKNWPPMRSWSTNLQHLDGNAGLIQSPAAFPPPTTFDLKPQSKHQRRQT
jgi:isochorismate pyruvate lyase